MKLWILRPLTWKGGTHASGPWDPWFDKVFGFIVIAVDQEEARKIASEHAGDESGEAWLDKDLVGVWELGTDWCGGLAQIVMRDFASA